MQCALINKLTGVVENIIEMHDTITDLPTEDQRPVAPAKPIFADEPKAPTIVASANAQAAQAMAAAIERQHAAWVEDCSAKTAVYEAELAQFNTDTAVFDGLVRRVKATMWEPPEGYTTLPIPADFVAYIGVTTYLNGELVNPVTDEAEV